MPERKKQNLLLLIPNMGPGGAQRVFHDHSLALSKHYHVLECVFNTADGIAYPTNNKLINLKVPAGSNFILKFFYFLLRCYRLRKVKEKYRVEVCISHLEGADYVNILSKRNEKVILCIHGSKSHDLNIAGGLGWIRKKILMPYLYNRAEKIITVSKDLNAELITNFGVQADKIKTINNFFDVNEIQVKANQPLHSEWGKIFTDHPVIITSGRLAVQKNQAPLLLLFSKLLFQQACRLVLLGDGELRENLVTYSKELGLRTYTVWDATGFFEPEDYDVYFLGYQQNPFQYIKLATVFAFPSAWEGFPMALCEAMACGIPVVTADCPTGPREILAPHSHINEKIKKEEYTDYGVLMPLLKNTHSELIDLWVRTLRGLLLDPTLRVLYKENGYKRMQDFTPESIIAKWIEVIN